MPPREEEGAAYGCMRVHQKRNHLFGTTFANIAPQKYFKTEITNNMTRLRAAAENPLGGEQPLNPHGSAGVDFTRGYADLEMTK